MLMSCTVPPSQMDRMASARFGAGTGGGTPIGGNMERGIGRARNADRAQITIPARPDHNQRAAARNRYEGHACAGWCGNRAHLLHHAGRRVGFGHHESISTSSGHEHPFPSGSPIVVLEVLHRSADLYRWPAIERHDRKRRRSAGAYPLQEKDFRAGRIHACKHRPGGGQERPGGELECPPLRLGERIQRHVKRPGRVHQATCLPNPDMPHAHGDLPQQGIRVAPDPAGPAYRISEQVEGAGSRSPRPFVTSRASPEGVQRIVKYCHEP